MAKIVDKLKEFTGDDVFTRVPNLVSDAINGATSEVANMLPVELLLKYAGAPVEMTAATSSLDGKKALLVQREDSTNTRRPVAEVNPIDFENAKDSTSMYEATDLTPVYTIHYSGSSSMIEVTPSPSGTDKGYLYTYTYPTTTWTSSSSETSFPGIPKELEQAVLLRAAILIMQAYISAAVQSDEDTEMLTMLSTQAQTLQAQYQQEITPFVKGMGD